uniref:Uncharacterized protein n=1 Tax=Arundo donax TaxID=35708 RepID=A0A0A8Z2Y3_ARUDO
MEKLLRHTFGKNPGSVTAAATR